MRVVPLLAGCIVAPAHLGHHNYLMRYVCLVICVLIRPDHHERRLNVLMGSGEDTTNILFQYIFLGTAFIRFSVPKLRSHASYKRYTTTHNAMQCPAMCGRLTLTACLFVSPYIIGSYQTHYSIQDPRWLSTLYAKTLVGICAGGYYNTMINLRCE